MAAVDGFSLLYRETARSCQAYFEPLVLVGALYTAGKAFVLLRGCCALVRVHFLPRMSPTRRKKLPQRFGEWAVINGARDAVARAYAEELARQGVSIMFVSHDRAAVGDLVPSLSRSYGVEATFIVADFSSGEAALKAVGDALRGKDVGILVNCVGEHGSTPRRLTETSEQALLEFVNRTVVAATLVTRLVLPGMVQRRRGAVVNLSSGAPSCRPSLGNVALSASTGFQESFSQALQVEYGRQGIFVQSLIPLQVASSEGATSSRLAAGGWLVPKPEVYVRHAISTLSVAHRTTGYWPHTLQFGLMRCVPDWIWVLGSRLVSTS